MFQQLLQLTLIKKHNRWYQTAVTLTFSDTQDKGCSLESGSLIGTISKKTGTDPASGP
jgi:hypothetical protein